MARVRIFGIGGGVVLLTLMLLYVSMIRVSWQAPAPPPVLPTTIASAAAPVHLAAVTAPAQVAADPNDVSDHPEPLLTVPVLGIDRSRIHDNWGDPRDNGLRQHHGTDIMAPQNAQVVAAAAGTVEKLYYSNGGGGITLYIRSPDRRWMYYYAHLSGYADGLHEGQVVREGELIAFVGDTGNAGTGNFHLHFGVSRMRSEERWWQGEAVNPYRLLAGTDTDR